MRRVGLDAGDFLPAAARAIVDGSAGALPDLSASVVLVPDLHAAGAVAQALREAAGGRALLLPQITTLRGLAARVELPERVSAQSAREVALYTLLVRRAPFNETDVWALATELVELFDQITLARAPIAQAREAFIAELRAAYRAGRNAALEREAEIVHELWWAQAPLRTRGEAAAQTLDAATAYALRLTALATTIDGPLYALALEQGSAVEQRFLEACAKRTAVIWFEPQADPQAASPRSRVLALAWPQHDPAQAPLRARAAVLAQAYPGSPLAGGLRVFAAASLDQQAAAIDTAVRVALIQGAQSVGVVVLDRLVARRARALLERANVQVSDEAGWLLSTTVAAACAGRLLDVAAGRGYYRDVLDLLRSPFVFGALALERRHAALALIEAAVAQAGVIEGVAAMAALVGGGAPEAEPARRDAQAMLDAVASALAHLAIDRRKPLARWLDALDAALVALQAREPLALDAAGEGLIALLAQRRAELEGEGWAAGFEQWRQWFTRTLEAATFRAPGTRGAVVFTYLAATRLRRFELLVLAGADAAHLPAVNAPGRVFNQAVRARLGLPTRAGARREAELSLLLALAAAPRVLVTWQGKVDGETNLPSPWFARLAALHREAWPAQPLELDARWLFNVRDDPCAGDAARTPLPSLLAAAEVQAPADPYPVPSLEPRPAPAPAAPRAPARISATGYETLMQCPYRYFAGTLLGLDEPDEVKEALDPADFGQQVHALLARFHQELPRVSAIGADAAVARTLRGGVRAGGAPQLDRPRLARALERCHPRLHRLAARARGRGLAGAADRGAAHAPARHCSRPRADADRPPRSYRCA
jgi:ATP-dependent helicase/nuclease subunit B